MSRNCSAPASPRCLPKSPPDFAAFPPFSPMVVLSFPRPASILALDSTQMVHTEAYVAKPVVFRTKTQANLPQRWSLILPLVAAHGLAACGLARGAGSSPDSTMEAAQRLLKRAVVAAKDEPLFKNPDAGQVITSLRTTQDAEL